MRLPTLEIVDEGVDAPGSVVADGADLVDGHFSQDEFLNVLKLVKHVDFMLFAAGGEEREGDEERKLRRGADIGVVWCLM